MIDLTKEYTTRSGKQVKLYDIVEAENQKYPVMGAFYDEYYKRWMLNSWKLNGDSSDNYNGSPLDLIEKPKYNFVKDQLVWVWNEKAEAKRIHFFSHIENGIHYVFPYGTHSSARTEPISYNHCEPYQPESKPLEEGELVVVWDDTGDKYVNYSNKYAIRRFHAIENGKFDCFNQDGDYDEEYRIWENCTRLSEFKL